MKRESKEEGVLLLIFQVGACPTVGALVGGRKPGLMMIDDANA